MKFSPNVLTFDHLNLVSNLKRAWKYKWNHVRVNKLLVSKMEMEFSGLLQFLWIDSKNLLSPHNVLVYKLNATENIGYQLVNYYSPL